MLNVVKYVLAVLFVIGGCALAAYKYYLGGGVELADWINSGLLTLGGAGYILYPVAGKVTEKIKNFKLPKFSSDKKTVSPLTDGDLMDDRAAIDHLMAVGIKHENKVIIDAMISLNNEVFKMRHQEKK